MILDNTDYIFQVKWRSENTFYGVQRKNRENSKKSE